MHVCHWCPACVCSCVTGAPRVCARVSLVPRVCVLVRYWCPALKLRSRQTSREERTRTRAAISTRGPSHHRSLWVKQNKLIKLGEKSFAAQEAEAQELRRQWPRARPVGEVQLIPVIGVAPQVRTKAAHLHTFLRCKRSSSFEK